MRRADRLFHLIQLLRRGRGPVTAESLAAGLEVSVRTVYRDIADLVAQRVPIRGEAGLGYVLERGFDMPPLMLTPDELEAAVLGAGWVAEQGRLDGDAALAGAARDLLAKIAAVVPERLRPVMAEASVAAAPARGVAAGVLDVARLRGWIRAGRKLRLAYRDGAGALSERTVWPVLIGYAETVRLLAAWCELREGFRHFRLDRIEAATFLDERHGSRPAELRARWRQAFEAERGIRLP